jgi:hypothetical protein
MLYFLHQQYPHQLSIIYPHHTRHVPHRVLKRVRPHVLHTVALTFLENIRTSKNAGVGTSALSAETEIVEKYVVVKILKL